MRPDIAPSSPFPDYELPDPDTVASGHMRRAAYRVARAPARPLSDGHP